MEIKVKLDIEGIDQLSEAIALLASAVGVNFGSLNTANAAQKLISENNEVTVQKQEAQVIQEPVQQTVESTVPVTENSYTLDQLAVAATALVDAGKREALVSLLNSFGVNALTTLPKEKYGAFATSLRGMGAKI